MIRCAELHLEHITTSGDPFESGSARPLDFGHWSAHKLEELTRGELRHEIDPEQMERCIRDLAKRHEQLRGRRGTAAIPTRGGGQGDEAGGVSPRGAAPLPRRNPAGG